MMKVPQMLDQMITARESFIAHAIAARHRARKLWGPDAVDGGLVALQVSEAGEVCGGGTRRDGACPGSA